MSRTVPIFPIPIVWDTEKQKATKTPRLKWSESENQVEFTPKQLDEFQPKTGLGYGVVCGAKSGLIVIDFDAGDIPMLDQFQSVPGLDRNTLIVRTQSGGYHFYYWSDDAGKIKNKTSLAPNVDVRAQGGYVVGPGSACAVATGRLSYEVMHGAWTTIAPLSARLYAFLDERDFIKQPPKPMTQAELDKIKLLGDQELDIDEVVDALSFIHKPPHDYDFFFEILCAMKSANLWTEFLMWMRVQPGFETDVALRKRWDQINPATNQFTLGTVFHHAKSNGWKRKPKPEEQFSAASFRTATRF